MDLECNTHETESRVGHRRISHVSMSVALQIKSVLHGVTNMVQPMFVKNVNSGTLVERYSFPTINFINNAEVFRYC